MVLARRKGNKMVGQWNMATSRAPKTIKYKRGGFYPHVRNSKRGAIVNTLFLGGARQNFGSHNSKIKLPKKPVQRGANHIPGSRLNPPVTLNKGRRFNPATVNNKEPEGSGIRVVIDEHGLKILAVVVVFLLLRKY